jgi:hypothetical protein
MIRTRSLGRLNLNYSGVEEIDKPVDDDFHINLTQPSHPEVYFVVPREQHGTIEFFFMQSAGDTILLMPYSQTL